MLKFTKEELAQLRFREGLLTQKKLEIMALEKEKQELVIQILFKKGLDVQKKKWHYDLKENKIWEAITK